MRRSAGRRARPGVSIVCWVNIFLNEAQLATMLALEHGLLRNDAVGVQDTGFKVQMEPAPKSTQLRTGYQSGTGEITNAVKPPVHHRSQSTYHT